MVRELGYEWVDYATVDQLLYVHSTCRVNNILPHLNFVRENWPIVEYHTGPVKGVSEGERIKEIRDCSGYVRAVDEDLLKTHPRSISMCYKADGWGARERK